ncbi:alpha/beta fold hydrolase [Zafaria sp. Z1313]|uniref:alpha/beta fold hydrolase n=1 Tax=unclassified Zafaria TaxID=2828765 RepID=UPI002E7A63C8|nr:alpha/beta fold hydrolase [Zafaria sp. J156]MEE1622525.1 alpha/beta fold hydrolase [Zafaria sp. J156]
MAETTNPLDGTRVSFDVEGRGPAVVLLHGSALSRAIWRGLGYVKALKEDFTVLRADLRGHGRSGKPHDPGAYAMELVASDVLAAMDAAGIGSAAVVGYSFGGRTAFSLAAGAPERVERIASLGGTFRSAAGQVERIFFDGYLDALRDGGMQAFVDGFAAAGRPLDPATRAAFLANDPQALVAYFERTEVQEGLPEEELARLELPALLMAGGRDRGRLEDARRAAELMPAARFAELPGRTHASTLFPADEVLGHLRPFLLNR